MMTRSIRRMSLDYLFGSRFYVLPSSPLRFFLSCDSCRRNGLSMLMDLATSPTDHGGGCLRGCLSLMGYPSFSVSSFLGAFSYLGHWYSQQLSIVIICLPL